MKLHVLGITGPFNSIQENTRIILLLLFQQITCTREKLLQLKKRLQQAMALYRRRLEWLTSESRRVFGVVEEKAVTVVLDVRNMSPEQFDQYRTALQRVLKEQFQHLTKFNLIR
jgi:hypothetical protein